MARDVLGDPAVVNHPISFIKSGNLSTATGKPLFVFPATSKLVDVTAVVGTAPTSQDVLVDVNLDGTTIFTNQSHRPTISSTAAVTAVPDVTDEIDAGTVLTVDIDQVGSGTTGADLCVVIRYYEV